MQNSLLAISYCFSCEKLQANDRDFLHLALLSDSFRVVAAAFESSVL